MKIISFENGYPFHVIDEMSLFTVLPDTCLLQNNLPFYFPDFTKHLSISIGIAVKITKVGKCIQPKFASSYYTESAVSIKFTAKDLNSQNLSLASCFDFSMPIGQFSSIANQPLEQATLELSINQKYLLNINNINLKSIMNNCIVHASKYITLKTGDIIYYGINVPEEQLKLGDQLLGSLNQQQLIECLIK